MPTKFLKMQIKHNFCRKWADTVLAPLAIFLAINVLYSNAAKICYKHLKDLVVIEPSWWMDSLALFLFIIAMAHGVSLLMRKTYIIGCSHVVIIILTIAQYVRLRFFGGDYGFTSLKCLNVLTWTDPVMAASSVMFIILSIKCSLKSKRENPGTGKELPLSDKPISKCSEDKMGFMPKVEEVVSFMQDEYICADSSYSIGIVSEWGTGKTSFMNMVKEKLQTDYKDQWIIVDVNPLSSKNAECIQSDFLNAIRESLARYHSGMSGLFGKYIKCLELDTKLSLFLKIYNTITHNTPDDARKAIDAAIRDIGMKIAIFIDDLDRLSRNEMVEVFKLISKNASFHRTVFITGYDKDFVSNIINRAEGTREVIEDARITKEGAQNSYKINLQDKVLVSSFEDKYFNKEFRLMVSKEGISLLYDNLLERYEDLQRQVSKENELAKVTKHVLSNIVTPRELKRYFSMLLSIKDETWQSVVCWQLALVLLLKYKHSEEYENLMRKNYFSALAINLKEYKLLNNLNQKKSLPTQVTNILNELFPKHEKGMRRAPTPSNSICKVDYFESYFLNDITTHDEKVSSKK